MVRNPEVLLILQEAGSIIATRTVRERREVMGKVLGHPIHHRMEAAGTWEQGHPRAILPAYQKAILPAWENPTVKDLVLLTEHPRDFLILMGREQVQVTASGRAAAHHPGMDPVKEAVMAKVRAIHQARMWVSPILYPSVRTREPAFLLPCHSLSARAKAFHSPSARVIP